MKTTANRGSRPDEWSVLTYVRPGPNAFTWLASVIRDLKGADPFRPVGVLVPNDYTGRMISRHLARQGGYVNVVTLRLGQAEAEVAGSTRAPRHGILGPILEESAVRAVLRQHRDQFGGVEHRSLNQALLELFRELRRTAPDPDKLASAARSRPARAALDAYRDFQNRTRDYDDPTRRAERATRRLSEASTIPPEIERLGALVLFLPTRLDPHDVRFLAAAARWVPLWAAFLDLSDPHQLGDEPSQEMAAQLASALGVDPPARESTIEESQLFADLQVIRAPDPAEEVREVVRCIAADLEKGIPLHRSAILYRQDEPYASLVRDALDLAGIPWSSSEGQRLSASCHGRCLLGVLRLSERQFAREAVMEWLESEPIFDDPAARIPTASWDRLTRAANVVRGVEQWIQRLERHAAALQREARDREREGDSPVAIDARHHRAADARILATFVKTLAEALQPRTDGWRWADFVDWARGLRDRFVGSPDRWPGNEEDFARAVDGAVESLRDADRIEGIDGPSPSEFLAALEAALDWHRRPTGHLGAGILIEPIAAVTGLAFDRVYVLGMLEGAFPPSPAVDPFFPIGTDDPLGRRARQPAKERQDFLAAIATADRGRLTLGVPDSDGARASFPSRWLLEIASRRAGKDLDATEFATLDPAGHPWLRIVHSARHAVSREVTPADLEDRRLQQAARWTDEGFRLDQHALAERTDLPLGRAMELAEERRSSTLTRFDGNVSALASTSRRLSTIFDNWRAISASAVQTWAICGFRYFLERVVAVEPTEPPEESWTIDPLDRGSLIHAVLAQFFARLRQQGRPRPDEAYTLADLALIETLAQEQFAEIEARGATGHHLAWENARSAIVADLRAFLVADQDWRGQQRLTPTYFEQGFGFAADGSWPALHVRIPAEPAARSIRFRGRIDRIDVDTTTGRGHVFDYKTGSGAGYESLGRDPVAAGQHVQLALYSRAVRQSLPEVTSVGGAFWFVSAKGEFKHGAMAGDQVFVDRRLDEVLDVISRGIASGAFPQVPGKSDSRDPFENCRFCDFERICPARPDLVWARKQGDPLAALHLQLARRDGSKDGSHVINDERAVD